MKLALFFVLTFLSLSTLADSDVSFRTPAKRFGSSYSVKITLRRDGFTYDVPIWVKPDQKISTLDKDQLSELGWIYKDLKPEDLLMSSESFDVPKFRNLKSEWVYIPDFSKSCCYGVLGQDVLKDFEVRFDPNPPAHLEWTRIVHNQKPTKLPVQLQKQLPLLFSTRSTSAMINKKKINLSRTPYVLNLDTGKLIFEPEWINPKAATKPMATPLFRYEFIPPVRQILVLSLPAAYLKSAQAVGFKSSLKILLINGVKTASLDHFEMDDFLTGKAAKTITLQTDKMKYTFDFEKNEFTQSEPIQITPGRN